MTEWVISENIAGLPLIGDVRDDMEGLLGTIVSARHPTYGGGEFIFLNGTNNTALGTVVTFNAADFSTTRLADNAIGPVAVATGGTLADTRGWYQIEGLAIARSGDVANNGNVYSSSTAGQVDDAVSAGNRVKNAKFASADGTPSAGLALVEIHRPVMDDGLAA